MSRPAELERAARAALATAPGPLRVSDSHGLCVVRVDTGNVVVDGAMTDGGTVLSQMMTREMAQHIAEASPAGVLALIAEHREAMKLAVAVLDWTDALRNYEQARERSPKGPWPEWRGLKEAENALPPRWRSIIGGQFRDALAESEKP